MSGENFFRKIFKAIKDFTNGWSTTSSSPTTDDMFCDIRSKLEDETVSNASKCDALRSLLTLSSTMKSQAINVLERVLNNLETFSCDTNIRALRVHKSSKT